jgi:hypothetical protein
LRADSDTEVRKSVCWLIQEGVDAIKIVASGGQMTAGSNPLRPQYPVSVLRTAVHEAACTTPRRAEVITWVEPAAVDVDQHKYRLVEAQLNGVLG